jgi:hypothetical protein
LIMIGWWVSTSDIQIAWAACHLRLASGFDVFAL